MVVNVMLNLGTNFKEIYFLGNFVSINLFQFWTHFEKVYPFLDVLSSDMLKLVLNIQEVDSPENIMGINFSQLWSDLEEIDLFPDLLWCLLRNFHKVDSLPHFFSCQMVWISMAVGCIIVFMLIQHF